MKIIFLAPRFPPHVGGIPMRAQRIAKGLSQRGQEVIVYGPSHPQAPCVERVDGVKVLRHDSLVLFFPRPNKTPQIILSLSKLLGNKEILEADIVQSFLFVSFTSLVAAFLKLVRKKTFTLFPLFTPYLFGGPSIWPYRLTFGNMVIRCADFLMPETSFEKNCLIQLGVPSNKIKVVPNAIIAEDYRELPDPMIFRRKYEIDPDERIILFVGSPSFPKGTHHLIGSVHNVLKKITKVRLVMVGPHVLRTNALLQDFGSSDVRKHTLITGPLVGKSLISAYSAADVFVLPSVLETFGMVMLEAAAAGLPIVCTRTGVAPDIVVNGKNGLFVRYGEVNQISNAIIKILSDDKFKEEAQRNRGFILKTYDHKTEIDSIEKIYRYLMR